MQPVDMCRINRDGVSKQSLWRGRRWGAVTGKWSVRRSRAEKTKMDQARVRSASGGQGQSAWLHRCTVTKAEPAGVTGMGLEEGQGSQGGPGVVSGCRPSVAAWQRGMADDQLAGWPGSRRAWGLAARAQPWFAVAWHGGAGAGETRGTHVMRATNCNHLLMCNTFP